MSELKPCPFCGSPKQGVLLPTCKRSDPYDERDRAFPIVRCYGCITDVSGMDFDQSGGTAITHWNTRASSSRAETGEPVAWAYEFKSLAYGGDWQKAASIYEPKASKTLRNILPLYATPTSSHGELVEARRLALEEAASLMDTRASGQNRGQVAEAAYRNAAAAIRALANVKEG